METSIALPDTKDIEKQTVSLMTRVEALRITDDASYQEACELLLMIKTKQKQIEPILEEPVKLQHDAWKRTRAWADRFLSPVDTMRQILSRRIGEWDMKIREKRRREAEIAAEEARAKAERERAQEIKKAQKLGDRETVSNLKAAPVVPVSVAPKTPEPAKIAGVTTIYKWDFEVVDVNKLDRQFLMANEKAIRKLVDGLQGSAQNVLGPGVRVFERPVTSGRA
jgi:hypothetical protein